MGAFLRRLATLASGSALGQVAAAAASPILSRVFTPADYGISGVVLSISILMLFVATLRYDEVIVSGKTPSSRRSAFSLSFVILSSFSLALLAVLLPLSLVPDGPLGQHVPASLYLLAPPILFLSVAQSRILPALLIQFEQYRLASLGNLVNGAAGAVAQIGFGLLGAGALGLLLGRVAGLVLSIACMLVPVRRTILGPLVASTRRRQMVQVFRTYRRQAYYLAPAGFMNTASMQLPIFVLAPTFGPAAAGAYFFCQGLANATLTVYRRSITALTAKEAQDLQRAGRPILPFMARLTALVAVVALCSAAVLFVTAERLIPFVFGHQWDQAGVAAKWLGFYYAAAAIHLPATALSTLLRFQRNMLVTQCAQFLATAAALAVGVRLGDFEWMVALVAIATTAVAVVHLCVVFRWIYRFDQSRDRRPPLVSPALV